MQAVDDGYGTNRKNLKNAESPVLDQRLLEWFRRLRSQKTPVSGDLFQVGFFITD